MSDLPAGAGAFVAALFAGFAAVLLAGVEGLTTIAATGGLVLLAASYPLAVPRVATIGAVGQYLAVLVAGALGAGVPTVLAAGAAAFLAWTFARTAAGLRADLGHTTTVDLEVTHVAGTGLLAGAGLVLAYLPYRFGGADLPPLAVAAFVVGGVLLTISLRTFDR